MHQEAKILLLLNSYSLGDILEMCDLTEEFVVEHLVNSGFINLDDFLEGEEDD